LKLSWNEIRARAALFAKEWKDKGYEKGQTQLFYRDFFELFGTDVRRFATFEEPIRKLGNKRGFIDLFWKGTLLVEQKSVGRNLETAKQQALEYFPSLKVEELPKYLLLSDFQNFILFDADVSLHEPKVSFPLEKLPDYIEYFAFIRGDVVEFIEKQEQVNIKASELMANLYDLLKEDKFSKKYLPILLVRLVFCLFAEDTGIFEKDIFLKLIKNRSSEDGNDLGNMISKLFEVLNTPENQRQKSLDQEFAQFPYVNGALFAQQIQMPSFNTEMRKKLIQACEFDWKDVSPAIFGSLFQAVMDEQERREHGAHYTSEQNILKIINPLFMDDLRNEFKKIQREKRKKDQDDIKNKKYITESYKKQKEKPLRDFREKITKLRFLDPACGCGNFLVVTYQCLRNLETEVLKELFSTDQKRFNINDLPKIDVDKFYGIEIGEFPAKIAQIALWMTDHLCNIELGNAFGQAYSRIPLKTTPNIYCADALDLEWKKVIKPEKCNYILGNPPFVGKSLQSQEQTIQVKNIVEQANLKSGGGTLDFVCAWFIKAGEYLQKNKNIKIGFVSTNSITQGEQVAPLWTILFERYKLEIAFAYRTFSWTNEARGKANVHCVIIGLSHKTNAPKEKRLFYYEDLKGEPKETKHKAITAYLFDGEKLKNPYLFVQTHKNNLSGIPEMIMGTKPVDGGNYIFTEKEKAEFLEKEPQAEKFFRPFIGATEFINNKTRYILALQDASPKELNQLPELKKRIQAVKEFRLESKKIPTQKLADFPTEFECGAIPTSPFLVIPEVNPVSRKYIPIGYLEPPTIPSNGVRIIKNAELWHFAVLTSQMHMVWVQTFGGRLGNSYRYSIGLCYNPFVWPENLEKDKKAQEKLSVLAQNILEARAVHRDSSLADLYNPTTMPPNLQDAHKKLDDYVDKLYKKSGFKDDKQRIEHLFSMYEKLINKDNLFS